MKTPRIGLTLTISVLMLLLVACSGSSKSTAQQELPEYVQYAPQTVQIAYQFALEHPEQLIHQPCYCGCGPIGHTSSLHCFIGGIDERGQVIFDAHGAGCGICVDIVLDVKRLSEQGYSQLEIRQYIDATYSVYGPPTNTPLPDA